MPPTIDDFECTYQRFLSYGYDPQRAWDGAMEEIYYLTNGKLPDGHYVIDWVEEVDDNNLFVHNDPTDIQ